MKNIREYLFWAMDFLKGSPVRKNLFDIKIKNENGLNQRALNAILQHAVQVTNFYKSCNSANINSFPVINKMVIRNDIDNFINRNCKKEALIKAVTSGSTGTPFTVYQDQNKKQRNTADTIFYAQKAGFHIGEPLYYFKIWNKINRKGKIRAFIENIISEDVTNLSDQNVENILRSIKTSKPVHFIGYASAYDGLVNFILRSKFDTKKIKIKSAIAMSEGIAEDTKKYMQILFGVQCVSRYSNVENGIIAQEPVGQSYFEINHASYYVESFKLDRDELAEQGEPGRIVVTDLYNFAMPMVRYDTGDVGLLEKNSATGKIQLSKVEGRKMDLVFDTKGNLVSSFTITNQMWKYPEIVQYQFIQKEQRQYIFKINIDNPFLRESELVEEFKNYFGLDAEIKIEYVKEIPLLDSGKRKKVKNEYVQNAK